MALKYFLTIVLTIFICYEMRINTVNATSIQGASCENFYCGGGSECYLTETDCETPPCPLEPACRPSCAIIRCASGTYCINGKCVTSCDEVDCAPGEECVLEVVACFTEPCPPIPTCKPIDRCAVVRCSSGYDCFNGTCVPNCDGYDCGPDEECYLQTVQCIRAPCYPIPACRPVLTCATINCIAGYVCVDRQCIPEPTCDGVTCEPGQQCYLESEECTIAPCPPPEPVCRGSCANILCLAPSTCINGQCVSVTAEDEERD